MENNYCDGFLCSLVDKCNKGGNCKECGSFCTCSACLFIYVTDCDSCYFKECFYD